MPEEPSKQMGQRVKGVREGVLTVKFKAGEERGGHQGGEGQRKKVKLEVPVGSANFWN